MFRSRPPLQLVEGSRLVRSTVTSVPGVAQPQTLADLGARCSTMLLPSALDTVKLCGGAFCGIVFVCLDEKLRLT